MNKTLIALILAALPAMAHAACDKDPAAIQALDTRYQTAVEKSDAATMDRLLADDFVLISSKGAVYHKADLLTQARDSKLKYERQTDTQQTVRFWGDTAVITAFLWIKGVYGEDKMDYKLWFSDVYACTPKGWVYSFGQAGAHAP